MKKMILIRPVARGVGGVRSHPPPQTAEVHFFVKKINSSKFPAPPRKKWSHPTLKNPGYGPVNQLPIVIFVMIGPITNQMT